MERIGFIGIGLMGHGMAKNLLAKGHPLTFKVHRNRANLRGSAGGRRARSADAAPTSAPLATSCSSA